MLLRLLDMVGGVARWGSGSSTDVLYCMIPSEQGEDPSADLTYGDGEVLRGLYLESAGWPTRVRVTGENVGYQDNDLLGARRVGMEFFSLLCSSQWSTEGQVVVAAAGALGDARARRSGGWIECRPHLGLELWDIVEVIDSGAGGGLTGIKRRVNGMMTEYEPLEGRWVQRVSLEGV